MRIARAKDIDRDLQAVLGLIEEARTWLGIVGTEQWASPWPDLQSRDARVRRGLAVGKTWIVWDDEIAVATVTIATGPNTKIWSKHAAYDLPERAVYAHRLITARKYAGYGLGAELIDWAGLRGRRDYGAKWIRIDVWTSNEGLHEYYLNRGFERCGNCADAGYPSGALFQKPVSAIRRVGIPLFDGSSAEFDLLDLRAFDIGPDTASECDTNDHGRILAGHASCPGRDQPVPDAPRRGISYSPQRYGLLTLRGPPVRDRSSNCPGQLRQMRAGNILPRILPPFPSKR